MSLTFCNLVKLGITLIIEFDIEKRDDKLNLFEYYLQLTLIIIVTEHNLLRQYWISSLRDFSLILFRLHIRE